MTPSRAAGSPGPPGPLTILLVEDDDIVRALVQHVLEREGYTVMTANAGPAALLAKTKTRIDLLLTDVMMPGMTGRTLADHFHAVRPDLPVLFMTGYADPSVANLTTLGAGERLVHKPFRPSELTERVREMLTHSD